MRRVCNSHSEAEPEELYFVLEDERCLRSKQAGRRAYVKVGGGGGGCVNCTVDEMLDGTESDRRAKCCICCAIWFVCFCYLVLLQ